MSVLAQIHFAASERELKFLLIGGFAVNAHGFSRVTGDLDLAVSRPDRTGWHDLITALGYQVAAENERFLQFQSVAEGSLPIDVMLANRPTFERFWQQAIETQIGGLIYRVVSLEHLIAMKLHVLKQAKLHRYMKDYQDVVSLVLVNRINLGEENYRTLFEKYGTLKLYEKIRRSCGDE